MTPIRSILLLLPALLVWPALPRTAAHTVPLRHSSLDDAQSAASSPAALSGTVQDPSGAVISHATVTLLRTGESAPLQLETDSSGNFRFEKLPSGSYTLTVSAAGFKDAVSSVTIGAKRLSPLRITLVLASQLETVTVGGDDSSPQVTTDPAQNQSANTFERAALDRVPVFDQDYVTTLSRFLSDDAIATSGVSLVVNGIEANGPGVTPSAVGEVRINQNPYSALFANPGRARLEITTKPGTPDVHGTVNFMARDAVFDAANAFATQKPPESRQYYEGSLTGPLSHDRPALVLPGRPRQKATPSFAAALGFSTTAPVRDPSPTCCISTESISSATSSAIPRIPSLPPSSPLLPPAS